MEFKRIWNIPSVRRSEEELHWGQRGGGSVPASWRFLGEHTPAFTFTNQERKGIILNIFIPSFCYTGYSFIDGLLGPSTFSVLTHLCTSIGWKTSLNGVLECEEYKIVYFITLVQLCFSFLLKLRKLHVKLQTRNKRLKWIYLCPWVSLWFGAVKGKKPRWKCQVRQRCSSSRD